MAQVPSPESIPAHLSQASSKSDVNPFGTADGSRRSSWHGSKPSPLAAFGVGADTLQTLLPSPPPTPTDPPASTSSSANNDVALPESFLPNLNTPRMESPTPRLGLFSLGSNPPSPRPPRPESPAEELVGVDLADLARTRLDDLEAGYGDPGPSSLRRMPSGASRASRTIPVEEYPLEERPVKRSPQPWEYTEPPTGNNRGVGGTLTTAQTRGFQTLREKPSHRLIPKSSYYFGPPPPGSAFGTDPVGQIGVHHPREVIRIERDYTGGEIIQFSLAYPLELEGRISHTQFLESINTINEILIDAHSLRHAFFDNCLEVFSLQLSRLVMSTHYDKQMRRLRKRMDDLNAQLFNPAGLNMLWPRKVAFMFLEIEYY